MCIYILLYICYVILIYNSCCGWIYKYSSSALPGMPRVYKRRWLLLRDEQLEYYDDAYTLESPRYQIACKDVSIIEQIKDEKGVLDVLIIAFGKDNWQLKFIEDEMESIRYRWLRKISNSCVNLGYRSRATVSTLANFPILHTVRQLVNDEKNKLVASLPFAPDNRDNNSVDNNGTGSGGNNGRRPSVNSGTPNTTARRPSVEVASPVLPPPVTRRRTSIFSGAMDSVTTIFK